MHTALIFEDFSAHLDSQDDFFAMSDYKVECILVVTEVIIATSCNAETVERRRNQLRNSASSVIPIPPAVT